MTAPLTILHIPHASRFIPPEARRSIRLTDDELQRELIRMTDSHTDELFDGQGIDCDRVVHPVSRLVVDPERFEDEDKEGMAEIGMGVIYTHTSQGRPFRDPPTQREREALLDRYYRPHHKCLTEMAGAALQAHDGCLIIDAHSFPSFPLPYEKEQSTDRPDICIGTDPFHTPAWLKEAARQIFNDRGWGVAVNRPFSGSLVPLKHYTKDQRVWSIMIEVNRGLYMDEASGDKTAGFDACRRRLRDALKGVVREAQKRLGAPGG